MFISIEKRTSRAVCDTICRCAMLTEPSNAYTSMLAGTLDSFSMLIMSDQAAPEIFKIATPLASVPSYIPAFTSLSCKRQALAQAAVSPFLDFSDAPFSSLLEQEPYPCSPFCP